MKIILLILLLFNTFLTAQEIDIVPYLKQIEQGEADKVKKILPQLKSENTSSPSIIFLEAVLSEDGEKSLSLYNQIISLHPKSRYADAALYRAYSFHFASEDYETAKKYFKRLIDDYPESPYIKIAQREFPSDPPQAASKKTEEDSGVKEKTLRYEQRTDKNTVTESEPKVYKYTIQAGAFTNEDNAKRLLRDFQKSGIEAQIKEKNVAGTIFHVVAAGKFESDEEAKSFLQLLNAEYKLDGRIIPFE
jgi:tetratricopeptide (TPR) repeat protein